MPTFDFRDESESDSVRVVGLNLGTTEVVVSSVWDAIHAGSLREDGRVSCGGAGGSTMEKRGASRRGSLTAGSSGRSSIVLVVSVS